MTNQDDNSSQFLPKDQLDLLIQSLRGSGYTVIAPTIDQAAIVYRAIASVDELPRGWTDEQEAGRYRLVQRRTTIGISAT